MNNTFSFTRFKDLLLKDGKMYFRNFGTGLIVFCSLNAIFWIFNLLFGSQTEPIVRFTFLGIWLSLAMILVPSKVYGKANLSREGVSFAMLPASSLEKFLSMFLYCAIVTPILVFFGGYLVDTLLSLIPFGGFVKPIRLFTFNELIQIANNAEGAFQASKMHVDLTEVFPIGVIRASFYFSIIQWAAIFMLGNMLFKRHKAGKTFACYLGISYLLSAIFGAVLLSTGAMERWATKMDSLPVEGQIQVFHNLMVWGMVIGIVITILLLFFTYRKIKTQKY